MGKWLRKNHEAREIEVSAQNGADIASLCCLGSENETLALSAPRKVIGVLFSP